jgi:co-chaperonin GroES (HSP10)
MSVEIQIDVQKFLDSRGFKRGVDGISSRLLDNDGNKFYFDCLCSEGVKKEGHKPYTYPSEKAAVDAYIEALKKYCHSWPNGYTVYWREQPSINTNEEGYYVYSRVLICKAGLVNKDQMQTIAVTNSPQYLEPGWRTSRKGPNVDNYSGFRATGHRILLEPEEVEKKSAGGIVFVEKTVIAEANRAQVCTVLEIGPDAWADKSTDYCEVGDRVLVGQYVGKFHESPVDGKTYRFVADLDIISPLPKKEA